MRPGHPHRGTAAPATDLHVCPACRRTFVVPSRILEVLPDQRHYRVELRCNSCGWSAVGTYDEDTMETFDRELDRAQEQVRRTADALSERNLREEIEAFARALRDDLVLPEDF